MASSVAPPNRSLQQALRVQARVISALFKREVITRFGRRNVGVLWLFVEPMLFTVVVVIFWTNAGVRHSDAMSVPIFAITGYSSVLLWRNTVSHCINAVQANRNLLYHRYVTPQDVFAARILLEVVGASASFLLLTCGAALLDLGDLPLDPLKVLFGWGMLVWFGAGLALLLGAGSAFSPLVQRIWAPISYILFPLSGAAFMVDWLPDAGQALVLMLPMVHCVELIREGFAADAFRSHHDMAYVAMVNLVLTLCGLALLAAASKRSEVE